MFRESLDFALQRLRQVAPNVTSFPEETKFEKWTYVASGGWVGGFWPGMHWLAFLDSGDEQFRKWAVESASRLSPRRTDTSIHDLGFLFFPSWGALGTPTNVGRAIMDTMMNLDLLTFASEQTGESRFLEVAVAHAETIRSKFIRPDGSTPHVFDFNPDTGEDIGPNTNQGYSPTSCWSRGQAWGIYGFTTMYRRSRKREFLDAARKLADFALGVLTPDHIPVWDYRSPLAPNDVKDSSAGAIMACGLLDLAAATGRLSYRVSALRILDALCRTCLTTRAEKHEAILARGTRNRPIETGIEVSLPYGDYYLMEALLRVLKPREIGRAIGLS